MKKSLAILLSLALVICMIPAAAFGAATENVTIDNVTYNVTFNNDTFTYNANYCFLINIIYKPFRSNRQYKLNYL